MLLRKRSRSGFSLIEFLVVLVMTSIMLAGVTAFFMRTSRGFSSSRIRANSQNVALIAFHVLGRRIRMAGCNPLGLVSGSLWEPIEVAEEHRIRVKCDANANGVVDRDEDVTYQHIPNHPELGSHLQIIDHFDSSRSVISNISSFNLLYISRTDNVGVPNPPNPSQVGTVSMEIGILGDEVDPNSGSTLVERFYRTNATLMIYQ